MKIIGKDNLEEIIGGDYWKRLLDYSARFLGGFDKAFGFVIEDFEDVIEKAFEYIIEDAFGGYGACF